MRLDKFLAEQNIGTRSQVKEFIRRKQVTVNGQPETSPDRRVDENRDLVAFRGKELCYSKFVYYMMHKPAGVISATEDGGAETVLDLLKPCLRGEDLKKGIFPVGRLDKDVTGLLILTNDGALAHDLLSPSRHVDKTYLAHTRDPLSPEDLRALEQGVDIGEKQPTRPALAELVQDDPRVLLLTIREGKFHQVKRMLQAVGNEVLALKRVAFAGIRLDETLKPGESRELSGEEIAVLRRGGRGERAQRAEEGT